MLRDVNTKKVMKNAYRITKNKYETSLRVRIPGGCVDPESLMIVSKLPMNLVMVKFILRLDKDLRFLE